MRLWMLAALCSLSAAGQAHEAAIRAEQDVERLSLRGSALTDSAKRLSAERDHAAQTLAAAKAALSSAPSDRDRAILADLANKVRAGRETERAARVTGRRFRCPAGGNDGTRPRLGRSGSRSALLAAPFAR